MHRNSVIAQVSDLHFGNNVWPHKRLRSSINQQAALAVKRGLLKLNPPPNFLVVTGDVANRGTKRELRAGRAYLESILSDFWSNGHAVRCILVPGNHDVWRTTWAHPLRGLVRRDRLKEWNQIFPFWSFLAPNLPAEKGIDVRPMSLLNYYRGKVGPDGQRIDEKEAEKLANRAQRMCEFFPTFNIAFLKFDSNTKCPHTPGGIARGMLGIAQRYELEGVVSDYDKATRGQRNGFANAQRIALVHHHLTRLPNVRQEDWMFMDDAGEVARWLARLGVRLVLHGHYHKADVVGLTYWNIDANNSKAETIVVSAGSATALDVGQDHNSYHYIDTGHFHTTVRRPRIEQGEVQDLAEAECFQFIRKPNFSFEQQGHNALAPAFLEALEVSLVGEEKHADQDHVYKLVKSTGYIDGSRSYFSSVELSGSNQNTTSTNSIPFVFTAIGAQHFSECECRATDLRTGASLHIALQGQRPVILFPCRVYFAEPLKPNQEFQIRIDLRLKMVMLEEGDYDMVGLVRFPRGVARIQICLLSEKKIIGPSLWELHGEKLMRSKADLKKVSKIPVGAPTGTEMNGFEADIYSPSALAYLFYYTKLA
jgi:hypothetical protein